VTTSSARERDAPLNTTTLTTAIAAAPAERVVLVMPSA
jgi:hypothetical protein